MRASTKMVPLLILLLCAGRAHSQDSISHRDDIEIKYQAKMLVSHDLYSLMNFLASNLNEAGEDESVMKSSYEGDASSDKKMFRDGHVQVEYDLNPTIKSSANSQDEDIEKYLKDFDLLYEKSDSSSIAFSNISSSPVKKNESLYIKVYFNSLMQNKMKGSDVAYAQANRVAEINPIKTASGWKLVITRIAFFNPSDTVNDTLHNILVFRDPGTRRVFANAQDSAQAVAQQQTLDDQLEQEKVRKFQEQETEKADKIRVLLSKGDQADASNDLVHALNYYKQAKDVDPLDWKVRKKIKDETDKIDVANTNDQDLYKKLIAQAQVEEENRQYDQAIRDYNRAIKYQPDQASKYEAHIRDLNARYAILSELYEKFKAGQYKEVRDEYLKALKKSKNSDFYLGLGQCYDQLADPKKAEEAYVNAVGQDARNLKALQCLAELYTRNNNLPKAISEYRLYLTVDPEDIHAYLQISQLHDQLNSEDDAIKDLDDALEQNAKSAPVYYAKAMLLLKKNNYKDAADNYTTSIRIDSTQALAFYYRGKCQIALGHVSDAASDFAMARNKGLESGFLDNIHGYAETFFHRSESSYESSQFDSAIVQVDEAISIDPAAANYRYNRGQYYFALKNYREAIASYDKAVGLNASYRDAFYKRGLSYHLLGEYKKAIDDFTACEGLNRQDAGAQRAEGDAYFALADFEHAAAAYENALKSAGTAKTPFRPEDLADIYNKKGLSYFGVGDNDKAITDFKTALKDNRNFAEAYFNLGNAYYKTGHFSDATENISKAVSLNDHHPCIWSYILGKAYEADKDLKNALPAYTAAIAGDSSGILTDAVYLQARCAFRLGMYTDALSSYNKAITLHQDTASTVFYQEMGTVYLNTSKYDSAFATFHTLYQKDSTNGNAAYGLATALVLQGKTDESITWFDRAFQTGAVKYSDARKNKLLTSIIDTPGFKALKKKYN